MIKKRRFKVDKLIRDYMPEVMHSQGVEVTARIMEQDEYMQRLKDKLLEEASEVVEAQTSAEYIEEIADLIEVIQALVNATGLSNEQIELRRLSKQQERGGFGKRIYGAYVEVPADSKRIDFYLSRLEECSDEEAA